MTASGSSALVSGPIATPPGRGLALDAGGDVDGVAHDRVRTPARGTQQTDRDRSRVDPDPEPRPVRMLLGKAGGRFLQRKSGAGSAFRVIRLIATLVERHHQSVTDNAVNIAAVRCPDRRNCSREVLIEHPRHLFGLVRSRRKR